MGFDYDPAYQGIEVIAVGQDQVLAKLSLPAFVSDTRDQFVLHPGIMDSAIQALLGFRMQANDLQPGNQTPPKSILPWALQELEIFGKCAYPTWVLIRSSEGVGPVIHQTTGKADACTQIRESSKVDIDLCDEQGMVWVRIRGLEVQENSEIIIDETSPQASPEVSQKVSPAVLQTATDSPEAYELMTFEEVWDEESLPDASMNLISTVKPKTLVCFLSNPENQQLFSETIRTSDPQAHAGVQIIFISQSTAGQKQTRPNYDISGIDYQAYCEVFRSIHEEASNGEVDAILYLWPLEDTGCLRDYSRIVHILQAIAATRLKAERILLAAQYENELERCYPESWIGFERSLGLVLPHTQIAAIYQTARELNPETIKDWAGKLRSELQTFKARSVFYQDGKRYVCRIRPTTLRPGKPSGKASEKTLVRPGGTYLITGGCGGLGLLFAEHLAKRSSTTEPVKLILTGRSPLDAVKQSKIKVLEDLNSRVIYVQADVCDPIGMEAGLNQAKERFGSINGVIHAAGVAGNQSIFTNKFQDFQKVLEPKITGTLVLDELLAAESLDFMCYFSSSAAILGDFGSCDYAVANRFLMAHAHYRNQQLNQEKRHGKTIAINWPLWKDGGMGFGDAGNTMMYLKSSGQRSLEAEEGLEVFDRILAQNNVQQLVLAGQPGRVHRFLGLVEEPAATVAVISGSINDASGKARGRRPGMKGLTLEQCLEWDLKEQISRLLKISRDKLDCDENLADFGFDSISLAQLANLLTNHYHIEITPVLFFGYSTIEKLTQYFLTEYQAVIEEFYREDEEVLESITRISSPIVPDGRIVFNQGSSRSRFAIGRIPSNTLEPIAIIGMSGRFPGARNIDELWQILAIGQDMVREIPTERFDWRQYYERRARTEPGKINCKWCGCIPGVSEFEPLFFEISPKEAESMDPRQRLLLQESWKALEDAGFGPEQLKAHKIGMFVGAEQGDYQFLTKGAGSITSNHNASIGVAASPISLNLKRPGDGD